jgi:hypothetical protein
MYLAIITLMMELLSEISAIGAPVVAVFQTRQGPASPTTPLIAAISISGAVVAAIAGLVGVIYRVRKEKEIEDLKAAKNRELEELRGRQTLQVEELQSQLTQQIERLKAIQSLQGEYDQNLRERRIAHYLELWSSTKPLARYPEPGPLSYAGVGPLATSLRDWYFKGGGLFMSEGTRDVYFDFQDGLRIVEQKRKGRWPFANIDMESPEDVARLKHHLRSNEDWEIPKEVTRLANDTEINQSGDEVPYGAFDNLRLLSSKLRTELAHDVRTREVSVLNIVEQQTESDRPGKNLSAQE